MKGNHAGVKWNKGGALRRNKLSLDLSGFEELVVKLEGLEGDVKKVLTDGLEQVADTVQEDTREAMANRYLPATGKYSTGDTKKSIAEPKVTWSGTVAEVGLGFDKTKPGAGGFLITGTPRMEPDRKLEKIYARKKYLKQINEDLSEVLENAIDEVMGGRK